MWNISKHFVKGQDLLLQLTKPVKKKPDDGRYLKTETGCFSVFFKTISVVY
jgi:hypothetical protein